MLQIVCYLEPGAGAVSRNRSKLDRLHNTGENCLLEIVTTHCIRLFCSPLLCSGEVGVGTAAVVYRQELESVIEKVLQVDRS